MGNLTDNIADRGIGLYELNNRIKRVIAANFPSPVWVRAEIASLKVRKGHWYFQLVEKDGNSEKIISKAFASLWSGNYLKLKSSLGDQLEPVLKEGLELLIQVKVTYHEEYGFNLQIQDIDPNFTIGRYFSKKQQIFNKLRERGLDKIQSRLTLPYVLQRIAVISSPVAAGFEDFCQQLHEVRDKMDIHHHLFESTMQGKMVERDMLNALMQIHQSEEEFDAIVIIRGGGGKMDLADFDNFPVSEKIALSPIPVLTGIGHEMDQSALDLVAHTSLKTPTAVAQFIIDHNISFVRRLSVARDTLTSTVIQRIAEEENYLERVLQILSSRADHSILQERYKLLQLKESLKSISTYKVKELADTITNLTKELELSDPSLILSRGFSITSRNGKVLKDSKEAHQGDELTIKLYRGELRVTNR